MVMSSSDSSAVDNSGHPFSRRSGKGCCTKGNWSGMNIAAMVIGFVLFWPIGLVILYWNISGRNVKDLPKAVQNKWSEMFSGCCRGESTSGNSIFEEFQQTQHDRISEIKEEIKNRARNFRSFRSDAKRRADEEEFNNFMSNKPEKEDK